MFRCLITTAVTLLMAKLGMLPRTGPYVVSVPVCSLPHHRARRLLWLNYWQLVPWPRGPKPVVQSTAMWGFQIQCRSEY